jgi:hypothetical protein
MHERSHGRWVDEGVSRCAKNTQRYLQMLIPYFMDVGLKVDGVQRGLATFNIKDWGDSVLGKGSRVGLINKKLLSTLAMVLEFEKNGFHILPETLRMMEQLTDTHRTTIRRRLDELVELGFLGKKSVYRLGSITGHCTEYRFKKTQIEIIIDVEKLPDLFDWEEDEHWWWPSVKVFE